jgi:hypothetical protein
MDRQVSKARLRHAVLGILWAETHRLKRLRKTHKFVIPRAGFARGICFLLVFAESRFLAPLGMTH